jgi:hypothetical protein
LILAQGHFHAHGAVVDDREAIHGAHVDPRIAHVVARSQTAHLPEIRAHGDGGAEEAALAAQQVHADHQGQGPGEHEQAQAHGDVPFLGHYMKMKNERTTGSVEARRSS